jgi:hypothetical protein
LYIYLCIICLHLFNHCYTIVPMVTNERNDHMTVLVKIKNVYGTDTVYPLCDTAVLLTKLTGRKTFTDTDIKTLKELGYIFTVESQTL